MIFGSSVEAGSMRRSRSTYMNRCWDYGNMVYKYIDIVGTSNTVITDAINNAFEEASKTVKNIKWGELGRVTFRVEEGKKIEYQAEVRIGFEVIRNNEN
jgi:dodecin